MVSLVHQELTEILVLRSQLLGERIDQRSTDRKQPGEGFEIRPASARLRHFGARYEPRFALRRFIDFDRNHGPSRAKPATARGRRAVGQRILPRFMRARAGARTCSETQPPGTGALAQRVQVGEHVCDAAGTAEVTPADHECRTALWDRASAQHAMVTAHRVVHRRFVRGGDHAICVDREIAQQVLHTPGGVTELRKSASIASQNESDA